MATGRSPRKLLFRPGPIRFGLRPEISIPNGGTDTNLDLAVANQGSNNISILLGNGDGTFTAGATLAAGSSPVSVVAANFHDTVAGSTIDLAVANQGDNTISIFEGNGDGTFKPPTLLQLPSGFLPTALAAADFNKDGHIDLAVADKGNNTVSIFLGNGDGTFQPRTDYAVGSFTGLDFRGRF